MSGTSLDGVDGVVVRWNRSGLQVLAHHHLPFDDALKTEFSRLNVSGPNELHRAALAGNALAKLYAQVVQQLLAEQNLSPHQVRAIGAHGQTVRHQPLAFDGVGYSLQIQNPALLAELTGIAVVADFRSRDLAAGGQGAPLVPAFHQAVFGAAAATVTTNGANGANGASSPTLVLNLGGMSNLTVIPGIAGLEHHPSHGPQVLGFDCGPGNVLMDGWCQLHTGAAFDQDGQWASQGQVHHGFLKLLLDEPFFKQAPPKSTGRDLFQMDWLHAQLEHHKAVAPADVMATLTELTACVCSQEAKRCSSSAALLLVCGGGAHNSHLMQRLQAHLPGWRVCTTSEFGLPPMHVEATAFAWLARQRLNHQTSSLQSVTGAQGARVLGSIYPA
ncbi:MAG: anhydro-N-acetylmuramic acid kinase [Betaproteobacteria bacterium]|nr:anhydro-N-acetylmuramic acid kinase [Betaproteobacteria bacterium]